MTTRPVEVPPIRVPRPGEEVQALREIRQWIETREGKYGDGLDRAMTLRDAVSLGLAERDQVRPLVPGVTTPLPPLGTVEMGATPPTPADLTATPAGGTVLLAWSMANYGRLDYYEVWRSPTNALGDAVLVARTVAQGHLDPLGAGQTAYYWVRARSRSGIYSPYNAVAGTSATTGPGAEFDIAWLEGQINETHLVSALQTKVALGEAAAASVAPGGATYAAIATEVSTRASQVGHLSALWAVRATVGDLIGGFGLAGESGASAGPTLDFGVQATTFFIGPPVNFSSETAPTATATGQLWFKPSTKEYFRWDGAAWAAWTKNYPFIVKTTPWTDVNGINRPPGVFMRAATIADLTVTNAEITSLSASKITAGYINAAVGVNGAKVYGAELYSGGTVSVSTDAGGNVVGFTANNPTVAIAGGNAVFSVDAFQVRNGAATEVPFEIVGGQVRIKSAVIGVITAGQINGVGLTIRSSQPGNRVLLNADLNTPPWVTLTDPAAGAQVSLVGPPDTNNTVAIRALEVVGDIEATTAGNVVRLRGRGTELEHITRHADIAYSSTTLTDVPGMVFALPEANAVYEVVGAIRVSSSATSANLNLQLIGTGTTSIEGHHVAQTTTSAAVQRILGAAHTAHAVANSTYVTRLHAIVRTGPTGGSVKLQAASSSTTTVTLREGSTLELKLRSTKTTATVQTMQAPAPALDNPLHSGGFYAYLQIVGDGNVYLFNGSEYLDVGNWVDAIYAGVNPGTTHEVYFTLGAATGPDAAGAIVVNDAPTYTTIGTGRRQAGFRVMATMDPDTGWYTEKTADMPITVHIRKVGTTAPEVTFSTTLRVNTPAPPLPESP